MDKKTVVEDIIKSWDEEDIINAYNEMCRDNNSEDEVYANDEEFFDTFFEHRVMEAVRAVSYGKYNYTDPYVWFNGYGNLESGNEFEIIRDKVDFGELADYIIDSNYDNFEMVWMEDLIGEFKEQFMENYHMEIPDEFSFDEYDMLGEEWDEIAEQIVASLR